MCYLDALILRETLGSEMCFPSHFTWAEMHIKLHMGWDAYQIQVEKKISNFQQRKPTGVQ